MIPFNFNKITEALQEMAKVEEDANKIEDITQKKVLIRHEQGFGDTIQFSRLLRNLTKYTKKIDSLIPEPLQDLFNIKNNLN